jgi:hypothetical protein
MFITRGKFALLVVIAMISNTALFAQGGGHPAYLHALSDLRAARWLIDHRPGNWQQNADEAAAVRAIDAAINEIKHAAIDDGKDINDHPQVQDIQDRGARLQKAIELLRATRGDIAQKEDDRFAQGLKARALQHVDEALNATNRAVAAGSQGAHPAYLQALSDLRAARWLIDHRPGNWQQSVDEGAAVREIDAAMNEIKKASIDDGKNVNDHPQVQEVQDRGGRLRQAIDLLKKTRGDVNQRETDGFAQGLKARALQHIDEAINATGRAVQSR